MKKLTTILAVAALSLGLLGTAAAVSTSDSHNVTVQCIQIDVIAHSGGDITLSIDTATAGSQPDVDTDATCSLSWTTNAPLASARKITAALATDYSAGITLKVTAASSGGNSSSAGQQTLSAVAVDVVTGVYQEYLSTQTLTYEASATVAAPLGSETKLVTYTLTDV